MVDDADDRGYVAHFTREEVEERIQSGELDADPDVGILPDANREIIKYLRRGLENPEGNEAYRRIRSQGVADAVREALDKDDYATLAYFRGWKDSSAGEDELIPLLMNRLSEEAMTVYVAATTSSGKTHFALLLCQLAVDLCDYQIFATNVPLEAEVDRENRRMDIGGGRGGGEAALEDHDGVAVPAEWSIGGRVPQLEWSADPELVRWALEWHLEAGLPLEAVVATTEEHVRAVAETVPGRVFITVDEYGTSGGGAKGRNPNEDRPTVQFVRAIRKDPWNASIAVVGHSSTDIPPDLRKLVKLGAEKPDKRTVELYETATGSGFTDRVGVPYDVGGHRLDDYNDKVQPPWAFLERDDNDGDEDEDGGDGGYSVDEEELVAWGRRLREDPEVEDVTAWADLDDREDYPMSGEWVRRRVN